MIETAAAPMRRLEWRRAEVKKIAVETYRVKSLLLQVANWQGHLPGQHVDIRLTAEDGYQAQRSYSIASPPEDELLTLTVERVEDGEVSPYLVGDLRPGDQFELRGPIGGHFVWTAAMRRPLCLIAGGSGIVPLMSMLRHRDRRNRPAPALLLYSSRSFEDVIYREELDQMASRDPDLRVVNTLTRNQPAAWKGFRRRVDKAMLAEVCFPPDRNPAIFICGSGPFVESVSQNLVELGYEPLAIKTERFGPSGRYDWKGLRFRSGRQRCRRSSAGIFRRRCNDRTISMRGMRFDRGGRFIASVCGAHGSSSKVCQL